MLKHLAGKACASRMAIMASACRTRSLKVAQSAEFREFFAQQGYEPPSSNAADFIHRVRDGLVKWAAVVKERNIKVEQP